MEKLISGIAPHMCLFCGLEGDLVCGWCLPELAPPIPSRCYRCYKLTDNSRLCRSCRRHSQLRHVWVATLYEGRAKALVHGFKFERKQAAAVILGNEMSQTLPYLDPATLVTYVPTASSRVRMRGYDHAQLLARAVARNTSLAYVSAVSRLGHARQVGARRSQRLEQLREAFKVHRPELVANKKILLVDDLVTTGGSLESVAACLRQAGAKQIDAVVFAQKQ